MSGEKRNAVVEFHHGRGCEIGQPYGSCGSDCGYEVVSFIPAKPAETTTKTFPAYETVEEALSAGVKGWNLRCNICGHWGAHWHGDQRSNWGALALCEEHGYKMQMEMTRHREAMREYEVIRFEQDGKSADAAFKVKYSDTRIPEDPPRSEDIYDG